LKNTSFRRNNTTQNKQVTVDTVKHDTPIEILGDVLKIENDIVRKGGALLAQLTDNK
jgi:hypothetical protein